MLDKPIDQITEADLQSLVDNAVAENKSLEYKSELPGSADSLKIKYLSEVSSLANTVGGMMIFGIKENDKHVPTSLDGVEADDTDEIIRRLEQIIRSGISPRIPRLTTRAIKLSNDKYAFLIRVEKSWASPHMVILGDHGKFYNRSSAGKYPMDVDELRDAFGRAEALSIKMKRFIQERNAAIFSEDTPVKLEPGAKMVCHFIPFSFADSSAVIALREMKQMLQLLRPDLGPFGRGNFNFEGFCTYIFDVDGTPETFIQLFRNGVIESTCVIEREDGVILPDTIENKVLNFTNVYLPALKELGVSPPIAVSITLLGAKGYVRYRKYNEDRSVPLVPISREDLSLPIIQIDDYGFDAMVLLRPAFDALYNALGKQRSPSYDENGKWIRYDP